MSERCSRPSRSTKISSGPLTMISVTDGSASSGSSTPRPIASSITRRIRRVRSAVERTGPSRVTMRPTTRSSRARRCGVRERRRTRRGRPPRAAACGSSRCRRRSPAVPSRSVAMRSRRPMVSSGSVALRVTEKPSAVSPGSDDRDPHVHGRRLALLLEVVEAVAQRARERVARRLLGVAVGRAATRLAVRAALAAWFTVQAASISCQTTTAASSSQNTMPISSADAWPRSLARQPSHRRLRGRCAWLGGSSSDSIDVAALRADRERRATPGSTTGTSRPDRDRSTSLLRQRRSSAPSRHASGGPPARRVRNGLYPSRLVVVGSVGELARALARRVAGEHVRVADQPELPEPEQEHDQDRQQPHDLGARLAALAAQPREQPAALAAPARPPRRRAARRAPPRARRRRRAAWRPPCAPARRC